MPDLNKNKNLKKRSPAKKTLLSDGVDLRQNEAVASYIKELEKRNEEVRSSRRAALNALEDAILSKEALRITEQRMRAQKEALQAAVNDAPLKESLKILSDLAVKETNGEARTAFYIADPDGTCLHPVIGAGNMPESYLEEIDGFLIGQDSLAWGLAVPTGRPVITPDVHKEPLWEPWKHIAEKYDCRSCWSFPINTSSSKAVGTFAMYFRHPRATTDQDLSLADTVVQAASVIISNNNEILQRFHAEEALHKSEAQLNAIFEVIPVGVGFVNADGTVIFSNEEMKRYLPTAKIPSEDVERGWRWKGFNPDGSIIEPKNYPTARALRGEFVVPGMEFLYKQDDGKEIWTRVASVPILDINRNVLGAVPMVIDIDKLKRSEEELKKNEWMLEQKVRQRTQEIIGLNTELKQLNAITANNYTEALRHVYINLETIVTTDARNLTNSSRANLRRAQAAIQKMKLLSNDINNYLQLYDTEIKKQNLYPTDILQNVIGSLQKKIEESNAKINLGQMPTLNADPVLFSKLMTHLLDNSIKFRKENTQPIISISSSLIVHAIDTGPVLQEKPFINITISDNGIGFENTETIFEPFIQLHDHSKHKGAGIGLAICKKIMEMHGGFITADSTPGNGTVLNCYFPA